MRTSVAILLTVSAMVLTPRAPGLAQSPCAPITQCSPLPIARVAWLATFAGQPAHDATLFSAYTALLKAVAPDASFHLGVDMPVSTALATILSGSNQPVIVRDGQFAFLAGCLGTCARRGFLWADLRTGVAFAGIEFGPSNGEPTPTETVFSALVNERLTRRAGLPAAFLTDLAVWERASRLLAPEVHYFMGRDGRRWLLPSEESSCRGADRSSPQQLMCGSADLEAADKDVQAALYLLTGDYAGNKALLDALQSDQDQWIHHRESVCPGTVNDPTVLACRLKAARARVDELTSVRK